MERLIKKNAYNRLNKMTIANMTKFEKGGLAGLLASEGAIQDSRNALEALKNTDGFILGDSDPLWTVIMASDSGIKQAAGLYSKKYHEAMEDSSFSDLKAHYDGTLTRLLGAGSDEYNAAIAEFDRVHGKRKHPTYGAIASKMRKATAIIKNKKDFSEDEVNGALSTARNYQKIYGTISALEDSKMTNLIPAVRDKTIGEELKGLYAAEQVE